jgi:hypothetical protein
VIETVWELIYTDRWMAFQMMEEELEINRETIRKTSENGRSALGLSRTV